MTSKWFMFILVACLSEVVGHHLCLWHNFDPAGLRTLSLLKVGRRNLQWQLTTILAFGAWEILGISRVVGQQVINFCYTSSWLPFFGRAFHLVDKTNELDLQLKCDQNWLVKNMLNSLPRSTSEGWSAKVCSPCSWPSPRAWNGVMPSFPCEMCPSSPWLGVSYTAQVCWAEIIVIGLVLLIPAIFILFET